MAHPLRITVLISGGGTTLQHLIDESHAGRLPATVVHVISSRPTAGGLARAAAAGIPADVVPRGADDFSQRVTAVVDAARTDLVCMAGFLSMWIIPPHHEQRVMNIHPALLPAFGGKGYYGLNVHRAVLDAGCRVSGCTVHFADNHYDHGPIIVQRAVRVKDTDTPEALARRVLRQERRAYPEAITLFAQGRLRVADRRVHIDDWPGRSLRTSSD